MSVMNAVIPPPKKKKKMYCEFKKIKKDCSSLLRVVCFFGAPLRLLFDMSFADYKQTQYIKLQRCKTSKKAEFIRIKNFNQFFCEIPSLHQYHVIKIPENLIRWPGASYVLSKNQSFAKSHNPLWGKTCNNLVNYRMLDAAQLKDTLCMYFSKLTCLKA